MEIVVSTDHHMPLNWELRELFRIGGDDEGLGTFTYVGPGNTGTDSEGRIYVLDALASRVAVFDSDGSLGRSGQGPGEMVMPGYLTVSDEGTVSVFDYGKARLVRFGHDGEVLTEVPFPFYPWAGSSRHIATGVNGVLVATMSLPLQENTFRHALQLVTDEDTVVLAEHSFPTPEMARYPSCGGSLNLPRIFEPQLTWAAAGRRTVVAPTPEYALQVLKAGTVRRIIRMQVPPRVASQRAAEDELGEGMEVNFGRGRCTIPPAEMVQNRGYAPLIPWIDEISLTRGGEIWVRRKAVGSVDGPIDVFDSTGAHHGSFPAGSPFPILFLGENRFGAAQTDEFDVRRLVVYEIVRSAGNGVRLAPPS